MHSRLIARNVQLAGRERCFVAITSRAKHLRLYISRTNIRVYFLLYSTPKLIHVLPMPAFLHPHPINSSSASPCYGFMNTGRLPRLFSATLRPSSHHSLSVTRTLRECMSFSYTMPSQPPAPLWTMKTKRFDSQLSEKKPLFNFFSHALVLLLFVGSARPAHFFNRSSHVL